MHYQYNNQGVCSLMVDFDLEDGVIHNVSFLGGCNGNLKAISKLVEGHRAEEIIPILKGNQCGNKGTSCADQFALALERAQAETV
jgi:uncharacterized protein (TIGR03905 family)